MNVFGGKTTSINRSCTSLMAALMLLLGPISAGAQGLSLRCENIGPRDGLPHPTVTASLEDRQGYLWFGNQAGLARFDGYSFTLFQRSFSDPNTLPDSYIADLAESPDGRIWVATRSGGLGIYDPVTEQFKRLQHDSSDPQSLSDNRVSSLAIDDSGVLWAGTLGGGLNRLEQLDSGQFTHWQYDPEVPHSLGNNTVRTIAPVDPDLIWVGTSQGLFRFQVSSNRFTRIELGLEVPSPSISKLLVDSYGDLWVGTESHGLLQLDPSGNRLAYHAHENFDPTTIVSDQIQTLFEDRRGIIWIGTTAGLTRLDPVPNSLESYVHDAGDPRSLPANRIASVLEDRTGQLWFGSWTAGLCKFNAASSLFDEFHQREDDPAGLADNRVRDFFEAPDNAIWIGMLGGGVARFDPATNLIQQHRHDPFNAGSLGSDYVHALAMDDRGLVWVGTRDAGLSCLDPATGSAVNFRHLEDAENSPPGDHILDLLVDDEQQLWIGTWASGLSRLDLATGKYTHYRHDPANPRSLTFDTVSVIYQASNGEIWVGTRGGGVGLYQPDSDDFTNFKPDSGQADGLLYGVISSISENSKGEIWITTQGGGFARMVREENKLPTFQSFTTDNSQILANGVANGLFDADGFFWISHLTGISRYDPETQVWDHFSDIHGTQSHSYYVGSGIRASDQRLYFGGMSGFTRFVPTELPRDTTPPKVVITQLLVANQPVKQWRSGQKGNSQTANIVLTHEQPTFGFEFAGLHFVRPSGNHYAYRLDGFDDQWIEVDADHRYANYTRLNPGDYLFRVRAANADGLWSEQEAQVAVTLLAAPWATRWAYTGYALTAALLLAVLVRHRRNIRRAELESQRAIQKVKEELTMALWGSGDELFIFDLVNDKISRTAYGDEEHGISSIPIHDTESFWAAVHPDDRSQVREALISHIQGHSPYYEAVYRVGYPPDDYQWAVSKARIVEWSEDGQPQIIAGASKNITELKNAEAALRDLNESLETLVDQRTVNLKAANRDLETALTRLQETQKQLVESEKMASLGGLVAGIAHEINTPLGVALTAVSHQHAGFERILNQLEESEEASDDELTQWRTELETNEIMTRNLERAVELINNFKLVAVDRSREVIRDFNLKEYLSAIVLSLKPQLNEGKHTIQVHCPEDLFLHSYPGALHQILGNLIMNSIHHGFVDKVGGDIRIDVTCDADQVELRYRDDGIGLAAGTEDKIFDPFFTTDRSRGSSGLGMHIVFNLVTQALGGTISASSEAGCCAEFVLNFPVEADDGSQQIEVS